MTIVARMIVVVSTASVTVRPGIKKSQNLNTSIPISIMSPLRTRFVEVPMKVIVPPATAAKERGHEESPYIPVSLLSFGF